MRVRTVVGVPIRNFTGKDVQFVTDIHANARGCEEAVKSIIRAKQRKMRTA